MMPSSNTWDVGEPVVVARPSAKQIGGFLGSSAVQVVFGVLTIMAVPPPADTITEFTSNYCPVVGIVRVRRQDVPQDRNEVTQNLGIDTRVGLSTGKLAEMFPKLFKPMTGEEAEGDHPFFLS